MYVNKTFRLPRVISNDLESHESTCHITNAFDEVTLRMGLFSMLRTYNLPWNPAYEQLLESKYLAKLLCIIGIPTTGQVFGYVVLGSDHIEIDHIEIHPELRRKRLGTGVIEALKQYTGYIFINCPEEVVPFWEKAGFSRVHEDKRPKLDFVLMSWGEEEEKANFLLETTSFNKIGTEIVDVE
jgi:GNAT superfamily N-acetyltransferase